MILGCLAFNQDSGLKKPHIELSNEKISRVDLCNSLRMIICVNQLPVVDEK